LGTPALRLCGRRSGERVEREKDRSAMTPVFSHRSMCPANASANLQASPTRRAGVARAIRESPGILHLSWTFRVLCYSVLERNGCAVAERGMQPAGVVILDVRAEGSTERRLRGKDHAAGELRFE
jgi:hypothetical protein